MKGLIIAASMIATSAFAASSVTTHGYSDVLGAIKLNNACLTESEVQSINPVTVCTKMEATTIDNGGEIGSHTEWKCVAYETKDLSYSRSFERTVCLKHAPINEGSYGQCLKWGKKADFLPETIKLTVRTSHGEADSETTKWFTFPSCN